MTSQYFSILLKNISSLFELQASLAIPGKGCAEGAFFFLGWQTELEWHSFQCFEVVHIASGC